MSEESTIDELLQLRARVATLEQLLEVHEQTVIEQSDRLQGAIAQLREHEQQLSESEQALLKQTTILQSILDGMADGVVVADETGKFLIFNPAAERIIGIGATQTTPDDWSRRYGLYSPDMVTPFPTNELPLIRAIRGDAVDDVEMMIRHANVPEGIWISVTARPLKDAKGDINGGLAVFHDITERKRTERRQAAQYATTRVLAEAATLGEATPRIIQAICDSLGWEVGAIWSVDKSAKLLRCVQTWHKPGVDVTEFVERTRQIVFASGVGLPGRVWATGQPAWISDVTKDSNFPRAPFAVKVGLHGAFGFPIVLLGETRGVIEFFSREIRKPDDNLLKMMAAIGSQIGQFIERRHAEEALHESEQRLQSILDNATAVIYVKDRQGRYILINRQYENLFHIKRDDIVGKTDYDLFPKESADAFRRNDVTVLEWKKPLDFDEVVPQDDGPHSYLSIKFPLFDAAGSVYAVCGISTDITDRKRTEDALKHERYLLHSLLDNLPDAIYFKDAQSRFTRINRALAVKDGLTDPVEAIGKTDFDFFTEEHARPALEDELEVMRTGQALIGKEEKESWPDGSVSWVSTTKLPLHDVDGKIVGTFGISRDITKSKMAEIALKDSEVLYHSLVESLPLNVFRKDLHGRVTLVNSMYVRTLGTTIEQVLGKTDHDLFPKELADKYVEDDRRVLAEGGVFETVEAHETPAGQRLFVQVLKTPVTDAAGAIVGIQVIFWDVTARKLADQAVQDSERRYRQFTEGSQDAIVVANQHGVITLFNAAAQKSFGYSEAEVVGQPITLLMPETFNEAHTLGFARYLATREARVVGRTVELRGRRKNGEIFHLDLSLTVLDLPEGISFLAAIRDTTERHRNAEERARMQTRVAQSERLASLGLLSAGVAHEINNPLAFIANNLVVLDRDFRGLKNLLDVFDDVNAALQSDQPALAARVAAVSQEIDLPYIRGNVERIIDSTRQGVTRVAEIVRTLRGFARLDQSAIDRVDIHNAISSALEMIQGRLTRRNIAVQRDYGNLPHIACAPAQLNQVFLNLLVNAMQAIEDTRRPGGRIEIATRVQDDHVVVEIADDGCGIPPEALPKIFDPFFTTKPVGEGTGLGLSITHGIVRDHNGEIEVESTPGQGTRFRVILRINSVTRS